MFSKALIVLAYTSAAFATVFITSPTATTTFSGGKNATIKWQDGGSAPSLKDFGPASISIYVGNAQQQTRLQTLSPSIDVDKESELDFVPDASIGPNSGEYFIRVESLALKDPAQPQYPAQAFSSKFTLDSMTGVFTADILAQIKGQSTAPLAGQGTPTGTTGTPAPTNTTKAPTTTGASKTGTPSTTPKPSSAASPMAAKAGWAGAVVAALVGAAVF